jgi:hypothetical protein
MAAQVRFDPQPALMQIGPPADYRIAETGLHLLRADAARAADEQAWVEKRGKGIDLDLAIRCGRLEGAADGDT